MGDLGRLGVRALADASPHALGRKALHVGDRPMKVGLDHRADVVTVGPHALDHLQGAIGGGRPFHVDTDEDPVPSAGLDHRSHDRKAFVDAEFETHLGQLDADVGVEPLGGDPIEGGHVRCCRAVGRGSVTDRLAEDVERGASPAALSCHHGHRLVERRAGHEAQRHAAQDRRPERNPRKPASVAEPQEEDAQRRRDHPSRRACAQPRARSTARRIIGLAGTGPSP